MFLPMTLSGASKSTRGNFAVREKSASAATIGPGASATPKSRFGLTMRSKVVAVPKSTTSKNVRVVGQGGDGVNQAVRADLFGVIGFDFEEAREGLARDEHTFHPPILLERGREFALYRWGHRGDNCVLRWGAVVQLEQVL